MNFEVLALKSIEDVRPEVRSIVDDIGRELRLQLQVEQGAGQALSVSVIGPLNTPESMVELDLSPVQEGTSIAVRLERQAGARSTISTDSFVERLKERLELLTHLPPIADVYGPVGGNQQAPEPYPARYGGDPDATQLWADPDETRVGYAPSAGQPDPYATQTNAGLAGLMGQGASGGYAEPAAQKEPEERKRRWVVPLVLGLAAVVLIGGVGGLVYGLTSKNSDSGEAAQEKPAQNDTGQDKESAEPTKPSEPTKPAKPAALEEAIRAGAWDQAGGKAPASAQSFGAMVSDLEAGGWDKLKLPHGKSVMSVGVAMSGKNVRVDCLLGNIGASTDDYGNACLLEHDDNDSKTKAEENQTFAIVDLNGDQAKVDKKKVKLGKRQSGTKIGDGVGLFEHGKEAVTSGDFVLHLDSSYEKLTVWNTKTGHGFFYKVDEDVKTF